MTPTFTVLTGSIGRPTLPQTLDSVKRQARIPGDQAIIGFDAFEQSAEDLSARHALVATYGDGFHSLAYDSGYHFFGVEQVNAALREETIPITGSHIMTLGDDDVFVDGAYEMLRRICAAEPERVVLFKFLAPWREVLWDAPRMAMSRISGCCIAAPRKAVGLLGTSTTWPNSDRPFVEHDFFWMQDIIAATGRDPIWLDEILVIARPDPRGDDVAHRGVVQCWACRRPRYVEDVDPMVCHCPFCGVVTDIIKCDAVLR